ncbi:MAG: DUF2304 domain-containing protein [Patescibacteria group bacterium]
MKLSSYQLVVPVLAAIACVYAWNLVLRQKKTIWEAILWTIFWGFIGVIAVYPGIISYLSAVTGIADQENAVLVTFLGILSFIVFYLVIRLEELEQRHTKIVRALALREAGLEKNDR